MDRFQYDVASVLKDRFEECGGRGPYEVAETGPRVSARQFCLERLEDNLVVPMDPRHAGEYGRGAGKELDGKMRSLRSSSAMTFNMLGNGTCTFGLNDLGVPQCEYGIEYERQARTLKEGTGLPAHLDAWLESDPADGTIVACEMKTMEWLTTAPSELREKYFRPENYPEDCGAETCWIPIAKRLQDKNFSMYDWAQMYKHTLALYNAMRDPAYIGWVRKLVLVNVVWEPEIPFEPEDSMRRYIPKQIQERLQFRDFKERMWPIRRMFMRERGIEFTIKYRSASDFMDMLVYPDAEVKRKLGRYR